ncbi:cytidylate kinase-like family protein [Patescibacteria group bacterium]|nr:cytidylate kinase-like family protein [Patescibacteria group bacterium]
MSTNYYPLVNKALRFFKLKQKMVSSETHNSDASFSTSVPFITISREPGSGGAPIAHAVAKKLDFELIDKQLIEYIARSTKKRKEIIEQIDEKARTSIEDIVHSILNKEYVNDVKYTEELFRVILAHAIKGKTVILGRGGNFVTPFARGLHVSITAPYSIRVQRSIDYEGYTSSQAKEIIAKVEKERRDFVRQYLKKDSKKSNSYDLVLNTTYFSIDEASDVIIEAFYKKFAQTINHGSFKPRD